MVDSKFEANRERIEELALRFKELLEQTLFRRPEVNDREGKTKEVQDIIKEVNEMGFQLKWTASTKLNLENPEQSQVNVDVDILVPKATTTIH